MTVFRIAFNVLYHLLTYTSFIAWKLIQINGIVFVVIGLLLLFIPDSYSGIITLMRINEAKSRIGILHVHKISTVLIVVGLLKIFGGLCGQYSSCVNVRIVLKITLLILLLSTVCELIIECIMLASYKKVIV
ncbi:hypothetical protein GJ496_000914 [Pomphorhynchus laevis]|nr:hypothetical protein GJ496_000914 [Pomphorhynchus laevis]